VGSPAPVESIIGGTAMAEREQVRRPAPARREEEVDEAPAATESGQKIKAELDDLLDEIDEVLESNAEDFVKSYIQKGGE
jgi:ubiquitin-like protein Pup